MSRDSPWEKCCRKAESTRCFESWNAIVFQIVKCGVVQLASDDSSERLLEGKIEVDCEWYERKAIAFQVSLAVAWGLCSKVLCLAVQQQGGFVVVVVVAPPR